MQVSRGGQNILLLLTNRYRTAVDCLRTYFGSVVGMDFYFESQFGSVVGICEFFIF
jgi:hypothetical protein